MKPGKTPYLFLLFICSCFVLASACSTSTPGSTATPAPSGQAPVATSTASPSTQASCPATGTARPAGMSSMASGSHQNIVYLSERGGTQTVPSQATLMRYDMTTGSKSTILTAGIRWTGYGHICTGPGHCPAGPGRGGQLYASVLAR